MNRLDEPVIILGLLRSRTTIRGNLLGRHSEFGYFEEPRAVWRWGNEKRSDLLKPDHATEKVKQHIRGYFDQKLLNFGKNRLLEKTPQNCLRCEFVDRVIPNAKYLFIYRDPVETIASIQSFWEQHTHGVSSTGGQKLLAKLRHTKPSQVLSYAREFIKRIMPKRSDGLPNVMWGPRLPGLPEMVRDMTIAEVAVMQWRFYIECTATFLSGISKDRYLVLKLEEMDESTFEQILQFLEIEPEPALSNAVGDRFSYSEVRRKREFTDQFVKDIRPIIEPTELYLAHLGVLSPKED
jgi:hypothetical protein